LGEVGEVIAGSDEGKFRGAVGADLRKTDSGGKGVADAFAAEGFLAAALAPIVFEGFGGTTVPIVPSVLR
jgi:hypothetical protein